MNYELSILRPFFHHNLWYFGDLIYVFLNDENIESKMIMTLPPAPNRSRPSPGSEHPKRPTNIANNVDVVEWADDDDHDASMSTSSSNDKNNQEEGSATLKLSENGFYPCDVQRSNRVPEAQEPEPKCRGSGLYSCQSPPPRRRRCSLHRRISCDRLPSPDEIISSCGSDIISIGSAISTTTSSNSCTIGSFLSRSEVFVSPDSSLSSLPWDSTALSNLRNHTLSLPCLAESPELVTRRNQEIFSSSLSPPSSPTKLLKTSVHSMPSPEHQQQRPRHRRSRNQIVLPAHSGAAR